MTKLAVAEAYKTIQGEGLNTGRTAVFVRFAGCNLWNGKNDGRARPACAQWCDVVPLEDATGEPGQASFAGTKGTNGGRYSGAQLVELIARLWDAPGKPFVVLTGGEPTLQLKDSAEEVRAWLRGCSVAVETNGTTDSWLPPEWHVTVSPKANHIFKRRYGTELKLVYPQPGGAIPAVYETLAKEGNIAYGHFYLQPLEPLPSRAEHDVEWQVNIALAQAYVQRHPFWRLSLQTHKMIGLP